MVSSKIKLIKLCFAILFVLILNPIMVIHAEDSWVQFDNHWKYMDETGNYKENEWFQSGDIWYYFDENGYMVTGWNLINENWYYFRENGKMAVNEWIGNDYVDSNGKWNQNKQINCWFNDGTNWKYINESGYFEENTWLLWNDAWFYLDENGNMAVGWKMVNDDWYYFLDNGTMVANE